MDVIDLWRYLGALLLVGGLLAFALIGVRHFGIPGMAKPERQRRLRIVETVMLSPRQRLVLVRRDFIEHLIAVGPEGAVVIEKDIVPPPDAVASASSASSEGAAASPPVFSGKDFWAHWRAVWRAAYRKWPRG